MSSVSVVTPLHTNRAGEQWTIRSQETLLSKLEQHHLDQAAQKAERDKAFDLLDALSRSGSLPVACAELHVLVAATHCFDKSLMNTIIQDNVRERGKTHARAFCQIHSDILYNLYRSAHLIGQGTLRTATGDSFELVEWDRSIRSRSSNAPN